MCDLITYLDIQLTQNSHWTLYTIKKMPLTDDEFYAQLDHCVQCMNPCQSDELRAYMGVCVDCHHADIFEIMDVSDDSDDDDDYIVDLAELVAIADGA